MNKILRFLMDHLGFFVFIILEILAFMLLVHKNDLQQSVVHRISTNISAYCYTVTASVSDYFGLRDLNEQLVAENIQLRNTISKLNVEHLYADTLTDTTYAQKIHYIPAKVVYKSVYDVQNYIIVDKGSSDGVEPDMGVISAQGVVGVVQSVSNNFSVILPLINKDQIISAKFKRNNQLGSIIWNGVSPRSTMLKEIPSHVNPVAGDSIVTSGYSAIFPEGILIGTVDKALQKNGDKFCDVDVNLAVDFQSLGYVTITAYDHKKELSDLLKEIENEK